MRAYFNLKKQFLTKKKIEEGELEDTKDLPGLNLDAIKKFFELLRIVIPGLRTIEFFHMTYLWVILLLHSLLMLKLATLNSKNAKYLVQQRAKDSVRGIVVLALLGIPTSWLTAQITCEVNVLSVLFRERLTKRVHQNYLKGRNFLYASFRNSSNNIPQADLAIPDLINFAESMSKFITSTIKITTNIVVFSIALLRMVGLRGPLILFLYTVLLLNDLRRRIIPPDPGPQLAFKFAHIQLRKHAEELASYLNLGGIGVDGTIESIFNFASKYSVTHNRAAALVSAYNEFVIKYGFSVVGNIAMVIAVFVPGQNTDNIKPARLLRDYVRNRAIIVELSKTLSELSYIHSKPFFQALWKAHSLVDKAKNLENQQPQTQQPSDLQEEVPQKDDPLSQQSTLESLEEWKQFNDQRQGHLRYAKGVVQKSTQDGGTFFVGNEYIRFENCTIMDCSGKLLIRDLSFAIRPGENLLVCGPKGSGKSSIHRVLQELLPIVEGEVYKPWPEDVHLVPKDPFLVSNGSPHHQIIYPHSPDETNKREVGQAQVEALLHLFDVEDTLKNQWDPVTKKWVKYPSRMQRQLFGLARLLYHRPLFAVLDECTCYLDFDLEKRLYHICSQIGITLITVSRNPMSRDFHHYVLELKGGGNGGWNFFLNQKPSLDA